MKNVQEIASWAQQKWYPFDKELAVSKKVIVNDKIIIKTNAIDANIAESENDEYDNTINFFLGPDQEMNNITETCKLKTEKLSSNAGRKILIGGPY